MAKDHAKFLANQTIGVASPQGRFSDEAKRLHRKRLVTVTAHGKHLFYSWINPQSKRKVTLTMHVHLGLYGKFRVHKNPPPEPRGAVRVRMIGDQTTVDLNGPTKCEIMTATGLKALMKRLGADPLHRNAKPDIAFKRISKTKKAIGAVLLDQSIIAGIGNIYRAEILHLLKINPEKPGCELTVNQFDELWQLTVGLFKIGMKHNRIITVDLNTIDKPVSRLTKDERLTVYKKAKCGRCDAPIRKWVLGARTMYACPKCQRR
jgi:endonuclease-8